MNLVTLSELYLADRLGLSVEHRADVLSVARRCAAKTDGCNGHVPTTSEIAKWLQSSLDAGSAAASVARHRRILGAILTWAVERELIPLARNGTGKLPTIRIPTTMPEAWTVDQVAAIVRRAKIEPGQVDGIPAALWWPAIILTTYWSGARVGSLLAVAPNDWDSATATLIVTKTKTGKAAAYRLHKQAADAVHRIAKTEAERLFPWPHSRSHLYHTFRRLATEAGVPCIQGKNFGLFHKLRRTMLSYCWAVDPAIAQRQADHSSPATTKRHYVDPRIIAETARSAADVLPVPDI